MFILNERLQLDTFEIVHLKLSRVLLMNDISMPWLILVPERMDVTEIHQLDEEDLQILIREIALSSRIIEELYGPDKINIGALGNLVPQLHVHIIGRYREDRAWPGPVWGTGPIKPYSQAEALEVCRRLNMAFKGNPNKKGRQG